MAHEKIWESDGLYRVFSGIVSGEEILESNFEMHEDPNFAHIKYILNDFSGATGHSIDITHTEIYAATDDIISETKGALKIAIVVIEDEHRELANSYRSYLKNRYYICEIFQTLADARKWVS